MSPTPANSAVVNQLRQLIYYQLDNLCVENALFLADRLLAYDHRSAESSFLLGLCHLRLGQLKSAYECTRYSGCRGTHLGCAYVFAQACRGLEKHMEGISALERSRGLWTGRNNWNKHSETSRRHYPDAAAVYCLLGKLWHAYEDVKKALDCYVEALKLNPFMWDAFTGLCDTGANIRTPNIFKMTPEMIASLSTTSDAHSHSNNDSEESMNGPLQSQHNTNPSQPPANNPGLFDISTTRALNGETNISGLFQKFNESSTANTAASTAASALLWQNLETPPGAGGSADNSYIIGTEGGVAVTSAAEPPRAPARKKGTLQGLGLDFSIDAPPRMRSTSTRSKNRSKTGEGDDTSDSAATIRNNSSSGLVGERKRTISGYASSHISDPTALPAQRRSVRLFNQIRPTSSKLSTSTSRLALGDSRDIKKVKATGTKGRTGVSSSTVGRVVSGNRKHTDEMDIDSKDSRPLPAIPASSETNAKSLAPEATKQEEALHWLLDLFRKLGSGYFAMTHYQSQEALQIFNSITLSQRDTPWVLAQIARAYHEQSAYTEAERVFKQVRQAAPTRLEDMEVYSAVLWHLKKDVDLAFLAHELIEQDRLSPQAWCVLGNSFSVVKEHDQALKCFKRASQLDPKLAYAFTLQGHEHVTNEEYDKAQAAYRMAITADNRHYNAWYGLGKVYDKLGKFEVAEKHFRTAASINPTNHILMTHIGMVLEKLKNPRAALLQYANAVELYPQSSMPRYKKARVLMLMGEYHLALDELLILKDMAPDEANVHFQLGKIYKQQKRKGEAIKHFTIAHNLDPKAGGMIKEAIEGLEEDEDDDEQM